MLFQKEDELGMTPDNRAVTQTVCIKMDKLFEDNKLLRNHYNENKGITNGKTMMHFARIPQELFYFMPELRQMQECLREGDKKSARECMAKFLLKYPRFAVKEDGYLPCKVREYL